MTRDELTALRDVLDLILRLPDDLRTQIATWLSPAAAKPGNGLDPHPPPVASTEPLPTVGTSSDRRSPTPYAGKARRGKATPAQAAEQRLLTAMQANPGSSVSALAKAAGANRSSTRERLQELAARGAVTKDAEGRWPLVAELDRFRSRPCFLSASRILKSCGELEGYIRRNFPVTGRAGALRGMRV